jgi:SAM-dependent methyltransferase
VGIDISVGMLSEAKRRHPGLEFHQRDAENLPFTDREFDAVAINFGLLHLGRPDLALAEAHRVLRAGGRVGFTVWAPPDEAMFFGIVLDAIGVHGTFDVPIPPGPPFFRFSNRGESERSLVAAGFVDADAKTLPQMWRLPSPDALFEAAMDATVRTRGLLQAQTPSALVAIREAVIEAAEAYRTPYGIDVPMPAVLSWAVRP